MKALLTIIAIVLLTGRGWAGGVEGTVRLVGKPPPEIVIAMTPECARLQKELLTTRHHVVSDDGGLANVFVTIRRGLEGKKFAAPSNPSAIRCIDCQLQPYVVGVQTGQTLRIENTSSIHENCHFTSRRNRDRNFAMRSGSTNTVTFDQAEDFIRLHGDVHPWLFSYVCVADHPFFAVTGPDGKFQLPDGLPDGAYTLEARHLKAGSTQQQIIVRNGCAAPVELILRVQAPVKLPATKLSL